MRPLPRVLAFTDDAFWRRDDGPVRLAAVASAGSPLAIVVRAPKSPAAVQLARVDRARALARPAEASVFGHADPALARLGGAAGVALRLDDLGPADARRVMPRGWIGVSVHEPGQAERAFAEGADYVVAGNVFETASHPGRAARGLDWLAAVAARGGPVFAIGGITVDRVPAVRAAGAWGVAAIGALVGAADPARAAADFVEAVAA